jgi:dolichol-phosphate mannosyltransferase
MVKKSPPELSVVVPLMNEEPIIPELYERLKAAAVKVSPEHELIFIDDGSTDKTLELIISLADHDPTVRYISFSRNFGHQMAIFAGLAHSKGNTVVFIDGDLQDPPELIPELHAKHREGYKVVYARRKKREGETFFKLFTAKLFYRTLQKITAIDIPLDTGDFRLIDRAIANHLLAMPEPDKYLRGQIAWLGYRQTFIEYDRDERKAGETRYKLKKMLKFAIDGVTAFSDAPLRLATTMGFIVFVVAFLIILYALFSHFVLDRTVTGWTSLIISITFIGGVQLLSLGIIGEYISRINNTVRNRPPYIIAETNIDG